MTNSPTPVKTVPLLAPPAATPSSAVDVDFAGLSHPGRVRLNNEDHFYLCRFGRFIQTAQTNLPNADDISRSEEIGFGMAVADGMGGRAAGEVASQLAINALLDLVVLTPDWILRPETDVLSQKVLQRTKDRFLQVNQALTERADADPTLRGFGTTMTIAASVGAKLFIAHIGDSRIYLLRRGELHRLTRDHTLAQALADAGQISQWEIASSKMRHALTQCLGDHGKKIHPDVRLVALQDGDSLLLCTDGLSDLVDDHVLTRILSAGDPAESTCRTLIDRALAAGGLDNVTAVVARYHIPN